MSRVVEIARETRETRIRGRLDLDGTGQSKVATGIGFFDHMLTAFAFNALFDLELACEGDLQVDQHHTVEDVGIALGEAVRRAVGDAKGIVRYGHSLLPMDEALVVCALDLSGRAFVRFEVAWQPDLVSEGFDYGLVREFHWGFSRAAAVTTHVASLAGLNNHHLCEASFKAFGRALAQAVSLDPRRGGAVPSTKGSL
jgi:imidazoleglycerol-phosphate dehydratase